MTTVHHSEMIHVLTTSAPSSSTRDAEEIARRYYGLSAKATPLTSERDQNFLITTDTARYVLKATNPAEDRAVTNFQTEVLRHIEAVDPGLPVPRIYPSLDDETEVLVDTGDVQPRLVRLVSFMPGVPLASISERSSSLRRNMGRALAHLGLALRGFFHPAAGHELLWDLKHASRLRDLLVHVEDDKRRVLTTQCIDRFEEHVLPILPRLRGQVIHNDFNPSNVMVDEDSSERITGILDFGDMVYAPLINDLGVAAAYHLADNDDPLSTAAELIAAYHEVLPLEEGEIDILFDLIATRLTMTVVITGWRAARYPENRDYILRHNAMSWTGLERLSHLPRERAQEILRQACRMG
ncbi:MAG: phosphotransferase [Gammaproteobacteria bacterium]|nr:phosphotransferase [Gammaproteobacteria bacterium]